MKKARVLTPLIASAVLLLSGAAFAQQAQKIAVIDSQRAFATSSEGKKATAQFQERDTKIKAELQKQDDAIRVLENRLNTGRLTMTQEALMSLQSDIDKKQTERKRYEEDMTRETQQFQFNIIQKIRNEMVTIIQGLRKERGYDLVLDLQSSGTVDFDPTIDITDEVLKRLNAATSGS